MYTCAVMMTIQGDNRQEAARSFLEQVIKCMDGAKHPSPGRSHTTLDVDVWPLVDDADDLPIDRTGHTLEAVVLRPQSPVTKPNL